MTRTAGDDARALTVRDAATVLLLRDTNHGPEVCMLRRNLNSDFVGGAFVFPGGGVDDADRTPAVEAVCRGLSDAEASAQLGVDSGGLAFWVAAVRECFEEAGVLVAADADGAPVRFDDPLVADRFDVHRRAVDRGERRLVEVCAEESLVLAMDELAYFSHWITPEGPPRRYDTRFFVARAPEAQVPLHDDRETIATVWIRPEEALDRQRGGTFEMIFPTIRNLEAVARFDSVDAVLDAARAVASVPAILPRIVNEPGGGFRILLPGDPGYDEVVGGPDLPVGVPMTKVTLQPVEADGAP